MIELFRKGINILTGRLKDQGLRVTLIWLYARGIPKITGIPLLKFSKVTDYLYVGPQFRKAGKRHLIKNGFDSSVNMRIEFDDATHGLNLPYYCYLPTVDDAPPSFEHLDQGVDFIRERANAGGKVYVHCKAGIGRAAILTAAYLIREIGMTTEEAFDTIRRSRPFIRPVAEQIRNLEQYENRVQIS